MQNGELRRAMAFLRGHLPQSDLDCYPEALLERFARHALFLRRTAPWCAGLDWEVFAHYVLFPRVNDEDLSFYSRTFYDALWPRVRDLPSAEEKVLEVNRWCQEMASYQAQDDRTASPLTVLRCGSGRCGEESAFLVAALRSVGIPARQVYAPRWAHCDDNHAWVEAWCGERWRFLGACEPEPMLDKGWFNTAASRAILVHSRLFGPADSPLHGEKLGRDGPVTWYNQTGRYALTRRRTIRILDGGSPAAGAEVRLQLLNEAGFHTIARLTADERGEVNVELGMGDVHVLALRHGSRAEGDCSGRELTLHLAPPRTGDTSWELFDFRAPAAGGSGPRLDKAQRADRARVLERGNALRRARMAAFYPDGLPEELMAARGNCREVWDFLRRDGDIRRQWLVRSLRDKDLRDVTFETLEDHLRHAPPRGTMPPELYIPYVLCPRIQWEPLTPWRGALKEALSPGESPTALWQRLNRSIDTSAVTYTGLVWTPAEALRAGRCDKRSLGLLYVACLRTLGIPARLRPLDGTPEYWQDGAFRTPEPEETGLLRVTGEGRYRNNWTLARQGEAGWDMLCLAQNAIQAVLPVGRYRVVTTTRLPSGDQFAAAREFTLGPGEEKRVALSFRSYALGDMLRCQRMDAVPAVGLAGDTVADVFSQGCPGVLVWAEVGGEPTEHVLNELAEADIGETMVCLLLRRREDTGNPTLAALLAGRPTVRSYLDDWAYDRESVARALTCDPDAPPLMVVTDGRGRAVYGAAGYRVGAVALLLKIAGYLAENRDEKRKGVLS